MTILTKSETIRENYIRLEVTKDGLYRVERFYYGRKISGNTYKEAKAANACYSRYIKKAQEEG